MLFVNFSRKVQTFPATDYKIERNKKNFSKAALTELNAFHLGACQHRWAIITGSRKVMNAKRQGKVQEEESYKNKKKQQTSRV